MYVCIYLLSVNEFVLIIVREFEFHEFSKSAKFVNFKKIAVPIFTQHLLYSSSHSFKLSLSVTKQKSAGYYR